METSVAVIMGSLTVVRSLLYQTNGDDNQRTAADDYYRLRLLRRHKIQLELESQDSLPEIPGAVMTGLRTFIRRHNHNSNLDTQATRTIISDHTTVIADDDSYNIVSKRPISLESLHLDAHEAMRQHEQSLQGVQRSHEVKTYFETPLKPRLTLTPCRLGFSRMIKDGLPHQETRRLPISLSALYIVNPDNGLMASVFHQSPCISNIEPYWHDFAKPGGLISSSLTCSLGGQ